MKPNIPDLAIEIENFGNVIGECFQAEVQGETVNVADALVGLTRQFTSPNEVDLNCEPANVVDGLFAIARGLHAIAKALDRILGKEGPAQ